MFQVLPCDFLGLNVIGRDVAEPGIELVTADRSFDELVDASHCLTASAVSHCNGETFGVGMVGLEDISRTIRNGDKWHGSMDTLSQCRTP